MFILKAVVLVVSLQNPNPHVGDTFWMTFETQHTCEAGEAQLHRNAEFIGKVVEHKLDDRVKSKLLTTECVRTTARI